METTWRLRLLLFISVFMLIIFQIRAGSTPKTGFRVGLTRVDANRNFSKIELLQRAARRSHHRLARLTARFVKSAADTPATDQYSAPVHAGNGEFLMELSIGTPPAPFSAIVDTGSDLIWTQCQPCIECFEQPTPLFNPKKSSSFTTLPCSSPLCAALPTSSCSLVSGLCSYLYTYGDSSSTQGVLAAPSISARDPTAAPAIGFGCGDDNQGAGFSQGAGLVGLGRGPLSLISQLNLNRFSYCLTSLDESKESPLLFGKLAELKPSSTAKLLTNAEQPSFYYLSLKGISVGGNVLPIPNGTFDLQSDGSGGIIIDSGTSITYLEEAAYKLVKKAFLKGVDLPAADGSDVGLDVCFSTPPGQDEVEVPKLVLHFDGDGEGGDLELPAENYMVLDGPTGLLCLTVMGSRGMSIFGNFQQQNLHVLYDLKNEVVSFEPTRCDKL
ncbi:LOW QUALITY PROTEIN: aspartic proteinase nepenthesin-1-like [Phalaenopsis equestris]|uniref:LOW QUALITY PROTEIN: aspartic proteinase nepenthesin-1-like n=1 Tax=Phalaenopsis equestris TaxID=78828 RepID=UPI0009E34223|nr:LOW QUALITY PROTEIN: aspartic proteinase nepenthesin-1-like [Phalaenopsis equestris]